MTVAVMFLAYFMGGWMLAAFAGAGIWSLVATITKRRAS